MTVFRFFFLAAGAALLPACGSSDDPPHDKGANTGGANTGGANTGGTAAGGANTGGTAAGGANTGGASGTGGTAAGPSSGGASPSEMGPCAPGSSTDFSECPSLDPEALFVSAGATGPGTSEAPMGQLNAALYQAVTRGKRRIVVCNETYPESVVVSGEHAGVHVRGGYTCPGAGRAGWVRTPDGRPTVRPPSGPALWVNGVADTVIIQDMAFESADAAQPGESSIAAMVSGAADLQLQGVSIKAGRGANAGDGTDGEDGSDGQLGTAEQNGAPAHCREAARTGGVALPESCMSRGGSGAQGIRSGAGKDGKAGFPSINYAPSAGAGGLSMSGALLEGRPGGDGATGEAGTAGEARAFGVFLADRYIPGSSGDGYDGGPGQGGGGGGASAGIETADLACYGAGGGAGGQGGCGGTGGTGGPNGGASVALISWDSAVTLTSSTLTASPGGNGGNGGNSGRGGGGALGGEGGPGREPEKIAAGGPGGRGGRGGDGGAGAGGSGGPSFAIVFHGREVVRVADTSLRPGPGGAFGQGGAQTGRTTVRGPTGANGASAEFYEQK